MTRRRGGVSRDARVSEGGRANEAGSLHRSGVAAYLAAHGLAGRGVEAADYPANGPAPVALSFETGEAVDDIRCVLADGTVLRLQAKRACGADRHLTATVSQWARQADGLQRGDKIGLATADPRGSVMHLGAALRRRRRSVPGQLLRGEEQALEAVERRLPAGTPVESILQAAIVMAVTVSSCHDEGFRSVANLLDGTVVAPGCGSAAIEALQRAFQGQAVEGTGSSIDDWLQILAQAGLEVFADGEGPTGPRRRAELDAVTAYRAYLALRDGIVEYSLVAEDLPPMTYEPLAESLRVRADGHPVGGFLETAQRWPRMLLTGLPGMGKSTALEQAAARWAADERAPVPIVVRLREVAQRNPRHAGDVTLSVLIEVATASVPEDERVPLRRALQRAAISGEAVLLLDGLDECRDRRPVIADGLAAVAGQLPGSTGIIIATRDIGLRAAARLNMPEARLREPGWLKSLCARLLCHAADAHRVPEADREQWVRVREQRLEGLINRHPALYRIPLFTVLATLLIARPAGRTSPSGRAQLLADAVQAMVDRWEFGRLSETDPRHDIEAGMLLDGYTEIAHAWMSQPGGCRASDATRRVEGMLVGQWGLAQRQARERAEIIRWFWDHYVGVFVASGTADAIQPRSRIFAEIGAAMWVASHNDVATRREWLSAALAEGDNREPVVLAGALSGAVAGELIAVADRASDPSARSRGVLWAVAAMTDGARPPAEALCMLIDALAQAATGSPEFEMQVLGTTLF